MPLAGAVRYNDSTGNSNYVEAGQALYCSITAGTLLEIENVYPTGKIKFLHLLFSLENFRSDKVNIVDIDVANTINRLLPIGTFAWLGRFEGRKEGSVLVADQHQRVFFTVIHGAFEVQNRLLETGDGLGLWNTQRVDFESLSENAILFALVPAS